MNSESQSLVPATQPAENEKLTVDEVRESLSTTEKGQPANTIGTVSYTHLDVYKRQPERKAPQKEREYTAARLDGVISKIKNAMQFALTKIQKKLMQPEVKQAGKQQIQEKAKESILDFLRRAKQDSTQQEENRKKQQQRKQNIER